MPIVGERPKRMGNGYIKDPIAEFACHFRDTARNILQENGVDVFQEPSKVMMLESANDTMMNFFIEESCDEEHMTAEEIEDHKQMMREQYINDRDAVLEYANIGAFNPVMGMTFPIHKNLLMNNVFDKGAISKAVAVSPKFTVSLETRILETPDGKEIDLFKQQRLVKDAMNQAAPFKEVEIKLPETGATDILNKIGATTKDNISIETYVSAVQVEITKKDDSKEDVWVPTRIEFSPSYGEHDRVLMETVRISHELHKDKSDAPRDEIVDTISATMQNNRIQAGSFGGKIKAIKLNARKDTSNGLTQACSVKWKAKTDVVEIPSAIPINTTVAPEEIKDIAALYQTDQLSKIMSMIKEVMGTYKDDTIKDNLDESYKTMPEDQKFVGKFDFAPREGYMLDHVTWRKSTFFDALDSIVTDMLNVLNDPNMTVTIFGRPDLIRKIQPAEYIFQTPEQIGPVLLDYEKVVVTSDRRVYQFISSQKLDVNDELIILLKPRNSDRIIYRIYDYQLYVSNDIRNAANHTLPAIHAFERWKFLAYQPVQSRFTILNPSGLKTK